MYFTNVIGSSIDICPNHFALLLEISDFIKIVLLINTLNKEERQSQQVATRNLSELKSKLLFIKGLLVTAWELKFISSGSLAVLTDRIIEIDKQASGWKRWFDNRKNRHDVDVTHND